MSALSLLLEGLLLGFSVAAPVGAIGVIVIRRTLTDGRLAGLVSGLGAATADAIYGSIAGFGLSFIANVLIEGSIWIRLLGGLFLLSTGVTTLVSAPDVSPSGREATGPQSTGLLRAYASTLLLTLANPVPIVAFIGIMAGAGIGNTSGGYAMASALVAGVFLGSTLWWVILSTVVGLLRRRVVQPRTMRWINRVSGLVIAGFGVFTLVQLALGLR